MRLSLRFPPTPTHAASHAEIVVDLARRGDGVDLDYSPASLVDVDRIVEGFRQEGARETDIAETLFSFGCYVGEVFVRNAHAQWKAASETSAASFVQPDAWMLVEFPDSSVANPIGKVFKRLSNGPADSLPYFYQVFAGGSETGAA